MTIFDKLAFSLPLFLLLSFLLSITGGIVLFYKTRPHSSSKPFAKWQMLVWGCVIGVLFLFIHFISPNIHGVYYDEDVYLHIAQNIAKTGKAVVADHVRIRNNKYEILKSEVNKQPQGYPFLVSVFFFFFGVSEKWGFILNHIALIAGAFLIGKIISLFVREKWVSVFGSLVHLLLPHNLMWANAASSEPVASAMIIGVVYLLLSYAKHPSDFKLYFLAPLLAMTVQVRYEIFLLVPLAGVLLLLTGRKIFFKKSLWLSLFLFLSLCIPHFIQLYIVRNNPWGNDGAKFALKYFFNNIRPNVYYYFNNREFPVIVTLLSFCGMFFFGKAGKLKAELSGRSPASTKLMPLRYKYGIILWFLMFWGVYLFFYAGSYRYGSDVRYAVVSFGPISIFSALGIDFIRKKTGRFGAVVPVTAFVVILINFLTFYPFIRKTDSEFSVCGKDHQHVAEFSEMVPEDGLILSHIPSMFALNNRSTAQIFVLTEQMSKDKELFAKYPGGLYLHWSYWCNIEGAGLKSLCSTVLERYNCRLLKEYFNNNYRFALYKIEGIR